MGWKGYETTIPAGMIFRKMYCSNCGERLKKQKMTKLYHKGEEGYHSDLLGSATIGMDKLQSSHFVYKCPKCGKIITYDEQVLINKKQKQLNKKILTEEDFYL